MISLSVEARIEPGTFRFQSNVLAGFLLHHFPLCVPPPLFSFSSSLSLSLSLCAYPFVPLPPFFLFLLFSISASRQETDVKENKSSPEELVGFYLCHSTHNPFPQPRDIGPAVRVFANGPGDLGSIPGRVIPKTLKMVLDTTLLNTQHYKVRFKGKVEQSWEWSSALPYTLV